MAKKKKLPKEPGLFDSIPEQPTQKKSHKEKGPLGEPDFFKNFILKIGDETFEFKPWNSEQKKAIKAKVDDLYKAILLYNKARGSGARFPREKFMKRVVSIIKEFFPVSNLKTNFDPEKRLNELKSLEPDTTEKQQAKEKSFLESVDITPEMQKDKKFMEAMNKLAKTFSQPRPDEKLKSFVDSEANEMRKEREREIIEKVFKHFFPNYEYNKSVLNKKLSPKKDIIIKEIQNFVITIKQSFNNLNKE